MTTSRNLREMLQADLRRAQALIGKVHSGPIDPQFRIVTPEVDFLIAITLTENAKQRTKRLAMVSDFMAWKLSCGFTLASRMHKPDCVLAVGLLHDDFEAMISLIERKPLRFSAPKRVLRESIDPIILGLRPRGSRVITAVKERELAQWFGASGKFPAVRLEAGGNVRLPGFRT